MGPLSLVMARPIWDGEISFGLINVQVELHSAVTTNHIGLHMMDSRDHARIRYVKVNEDTGEEVPWDQIVKGYELSDDNYVVIDPEELKEIKPELTQTIELEEFVDYNELSLLLFDKPYYLVPKKRSRKSYILLREVLKQKNKVGIGKVVVRTKEYIAALLPIEDALVLNLLLFPQDIKPMEDFDFPSADSREAEKIKSKELELSAQLVDSMTSTWDPAKYHDEYREALQKWIEEKSKEKGGKRKSAISKPKKTKEKDNVINIEELLQKSLLANRSTKKSKSKATSKRKGS
jgi:DNA end-binding protein Ku